MVKPSKTADAPVQIEPLSSVEKKGQTPSTPVWEDPDYPAEWKDMGKEITEMVKAGFKYYRRNHQNGKTYMVLRKGKKDKGLGVVSEEKEGKLFKFYPDIVTALDFARPAPWTPQNTQQRSFLSVPINRVAIIPRDYVPSINVIRYFQILKENGFPGDFSKFINDIVTRHFRVCNNMKLPLLVEEDIQLTKEGENVQAAT